MKNINFKVRFKNKTFIIGVISAVILLAQQVASLLGYELDKAVSQQLMDIANTVLGIMVALGVIVDPTTQGVKDSERAIRYEELGK